MINILHLTQRRRHFCDLSHYLLSKCNYKNFNITICGVYGEEKEIESLAEKSKNLGLNVSTLFVADTVKNYMDKICAAAEMDYEYTIKMDEDIFMASAAWDFFFNSLEQLNDESNILIAPALTTGIPTCDYFIKEYLNENEINILFDIFNNCNIPDAWGANYSIIRKYLKNEKYSSDKYYNSVKQINHVYKGIHPIRMSKEAIIYLNNLVLQKIPQFLENKNFVITKMTEPYLCNSFFGIKTKLWNRILNDKSLYYDAFDEVVINNYKSKTNKNFLIIKNAFAIHTLYNSLHCEMGMSLDDMNTLEFNFVNNLNNKIKFYLG